VRAATKCTIWLSFTSNMVSSGVREVIRYLVEHKLVQVIVTSAGAVEEDIMKTLRPHYMGSFELEGKGLRMRGINRIGNLLVPNLNYVSFEDWFAPLLEELHDEQEKSGEVFSPSKIVDRMGAKVNDASSIWYWAHKHGIPVFCPGITDGAIGDMVYFHLWKRAGFVIDVAQDVRRINDISVKARVQGARARAHARTHARGRDSCACVPGQSRWVTTHALASRPCTPSVAQTKKSGMIILGGATPKHHTCNANLMRNGADFAVFINTGSDFDGSDSGARPDEAVSWGKIRLTATPVKIYADATLVFPLLVAQTFAKQVAREREQAAAAAASRAPTSEDATAAAAAT
jgi:deoxyhypusine synthase